MLSAWNSVWQWQVHAEKILGNGAEAVTLIVAVAWALQLG